MLNYVGSLSVVCTHQRVAEDRNVEELLDHGVLVAGSSKVLQASVAVLSTVAFAGVEVALLGLFHSHDKAGPVLAHNLIKLFNSQKVVDQIQEKFIGRFTRFVVVALKQSSFLEHYQVLLLCERSDGFLSDAAAVAKEQLVQDHLGDLVGLILLEDDLRLLVLVGSAQELSG